MAGYRVVLGLTVLQTARQHGDAVCAGGVAGAKIATWQRMGSVYGNTGARKKTVQDPYQVGMTPALSHLLRPAGTSRFLSSSVAIDHHHSASTVHDVD